MTKVLSESDVRILADTIRRVRGGDGNGRPIPRRRREVFVDSKGTVLRASPVGNVTPAEQEYTARVIELIQGSESRTEIPVLNRGESLSPTDVLLLWKRDKDKKYEPDRKGEGSGGGGSGSTILPFRLTQHKALDADTAEATHLLTGLPIVVTDYTHDFVGKEGHQGFALQTTVNFNGTGRPGGSVIVMQTPLRLIVVELYGIYSMTGTLCKPLNADALKQYGHPFEGVPPTEDPIPVSDPYNIAVKAQVKDRWVIIFSEKENLYHFLFPLDTVKLPIRIQGKTKKSISRTDSKITLSNVTLISGNLPIGTSLPDEVDVTIDANAKINVPTDTKIFAVQQLLVGTSLKDQWSAGDGENWHWLARGKEGFDPTKKMVLYSEGSGETGVQWKEMKDVELITSIDRIELTIASGNQLTATIHFKKQSLKVMVNGDPVSQTIAGSLTGVVCP